MGVRPPPPSPRGYDQAQRRRSRSIRSTVTGFFAVTGALVLVLSAIALSNNVSSSPSRLNNIVDQVDLMTVTANHAGQIATLCSSQSDKTNQAALPSHYATGRSSKYNYLYEIWSGIPEPNKTAAPDAKDAYHHVILANFITPQTSIRTDDVVMVTHTSTAKLANLGIQIRWWCGPTAASIYVNSMHDIDKLIDFVRVDHDGLDLVNSVLANTTLHLVLEKTGGGAGYPHNVLRNLGVERLESDYFVGLDVDFIPGPKYTYEQLSQLLHDPVHGDPEVKWNLHHKHVFVLPAFEMPGRRTRTSPPTEDMLPNSKVGVINKKLKSFHRRHIMTHGPTNYVKWREPTNETFYEIKPGNTYEPYILAYRHGIPRYWKDFRGFGNDKSSWIAEIMKAEYRFQVLSDFYVLHMNHHVNKTNAKYYGDLSKSVFGQFRKYIGDHYYESTINMTYQQSINETDRERRLRKRQNKKQKNQ